MRGRRSDFVPPSERTHRVKGVGTRNWGRRLVTTTRAVTLRLVRSVGQGTRIRPVAVTTETLIASSSG